MKTKLFVFLPLAGFLVFVAFSFVEHSENLTSRAQRTTTKNDLLILTYAVNNFSVDYGRFPQITENGSIETAADNARLIKILNGGVSKENHRGVRYLEINVRKKGRKYGVDPETGVWQDHWGNFYRLRTKNNHTPSSPIPSPYSQDEPNGIDESSIAWSLGPDGLRGRQNNPHTKDSSDDIVSWKK